MASTSVLAVTAASPRDHWAWRPEWTPDRTCLYWYLTFRREDIGAAIDESMLQLVRDTAWLDAVPLEWCHVTVADVDAGELPHHRAGDRSQRPVEVDERPHLHLRGRRTNILMQDCLM